MIAFTSPLSCPLYFSMSNLSICSLLIRKHENSYEGIKYKIQLRGVSNITDPNDPSKGKAFWQNTKRRNKFLIPIIFTLFTIKLVAFRVINISLLLCISISMSLFSSFLLPYCPGLFIFHIILRRNSNYEMVQRHSYYCLHLHSYRIDVENKKRCSTTSKKSVLVDSTDCETIF